MSDLINIARSGILAYRDALSVTARNIANVNTEGYHRQEIMLQGLTGGQMSPLTPALAGQGVRVEDVRRAFDAFLAQNGHTTSSQLGSAEAFVTSAQALENALYAGETGLTAMLDQFFADLGVVSQYPADLAARSVALQAGHAFAGYLSELALGLAGMQDQIADQAVQVADTANGILHDLAQVQDQIATAGPSGSNAGLLDRRDALLSSLSELVGITTNYMASGEIRVTLGTSGAGPVLLDGTTASRIEVEARNNGLSTYVNTGAVRVQTNLVVGGVLQGQLMAWGLVDQTITRLDGLAAGLAADMNTLHAQGLDLNGLPGGDMFALDGWQVVGAVSNGGSTAVETTITGPQTSGQIMLEYDEPTQLWRAYDTMGIELGSGQDTIVLQGVTLNMTGQPAGGDLFSLDYSAASAAHMRFLLDQPEDIAASGATLVGSDVGNTGSAVVTAIAITGAPSGLTSLDGLLPGALTSIGASTFLFPGVVGMIPANTTAFELASLAQQSSLFFSLGAAQMADAQDMTFSIDGQGHQFDLSRPTPALDWTDMADLAGLLNSGVLQNAFGQSLADLGLYASGAGGQLTLSAATGDFGLGAEIQTTGAPIAGVSTAAQPLASSIQVFTREGVHLAGTPLSAAEIAGLLTTANGFAPDAAYRAEYLNLAGSLGYRGLDFSRSTAMGDHVVSLSPTGFAAAPATWSGTVPAPQHPADTLNFDLGPAGAYNFAIPEGASALQVAGLVNAATDLPLSASAATRVELHAPQDGVLSFTLEADNLAPILVSGTIAGGRMDALAGAVNAISGQTGVVASLSPDGGRLFLEHASGETVTITGLTHDQGAETAVNSVDAAGAAIPGTSVLLGGATADAARFVGEVSLQAAGVFSAELGGATQGSVADPFSAGLVARVSAQAGAVQSLTFVVDPLLDGAAADLLGAEATAPGTLYSVSIPGVAGGTSYDATVSTAGLAPVDAAAVAQALAAALRGQAPVPGLTGDAVATLPPDGSEITVSVGAQDYTLRMVGGVVSVSGPEPGRLVAAFDAGNQLNITAAGGALDGTTLQASGDPTALAAFGLGAGSSAASALTGRPLDMAVLPQGDTTMTVSVAGVDYDVTVNRNVNAISVAAGPGFPGSVSYDALSGQVSIDAPSSAGAMQIAPQADAALLGFATTGASLTVSGSSLEIRSTDGNAVSVNAQVQSLAPERLSLSGLPDEELIVVLTGAGSALRLTGGLDLLPATTTALPESFDIRITDAASGMVEVIDAATGDVIATRQLDAGGSTTVAGYQITISGQAATGDVFHITEGSMGAGDNRNLEALLDLRTLDPVTGQGGFSELFGALVIDVGAQVASGHNRVSVADAAHESATLSLSELTGVNLDEEAVKLLEQQQAYQASARVLSTARDMFDTILNL